MAFEKLKKTVSEASKTVGEKTKQGSDIVKANLKISSEEKALTDLYTEIGRTAYEVNGGVACREEVKELFEKVAEKTALIESLKQQLRSLKGVVVCDSCGAEVSLENDFCGKCGAKLVKPEPAAEETTEEIIDHEDTVEVSEADVEINIEVDPEDKAE